MQWLLAAVLSCAAVAAPAEELGAASARMLERTRSKMAQNLLRLPNYTCLQTIERSVRLVPSKRFHFLDTIRIEVALVQGKELFAWPGAGKFEEKEIGDMVSGGAIGNGAFALHAKGIFQTDVPTFQDAGELALDERTAHKWEFSVPQKRSGYLIRSGEREAIVGYKGAFWADAKTLEVLRFRVDATDIPERLELKSVTSSVDYQRVTISGETFLLPAVSELYMTDLRGNISQNRTRFSSCRQYTGESVLMFDDPVGGEGGVKQPIREVTLPPKLSLDMELQTVIDGQNAAVGDPVTAALKRQVKLPDISLPKGSLIHGRIVLLRRVAGARMPSYIVGLKFFEVEAPGIRASMESKLESLYDLGRTASMGPFGGRVLANADYSGLVSEGSVFFVQGYNLKIERGFRMVWRTQLVKTEEIN